MKTQDKTPRKEPEKPPQTHPNFDIVTDAQGRTVYRPKAHSATAKALALITRKQPIRD